MPRIDKSSVATANLEANRSGKLTDTQLKQLEPAFRAARQRLTNSLITALIVGGLGTFFGTSSTFSSMSPSMKIGALAAIGFFIVYTVLRTFLGSRDLLQRKISIVEGTVQHLTGHTRTGAAVNVVQIGTVKFYVKPELFEAFREGQPYKVYYIHFPPANVLLSVE